MTGCVAALIGERESAKFTKEMGLVVKVEENDLTRGGV